VALGINWDEALNEILSEENERIKVREFVKNVRVRSNISRKNNKYQAVRF